MAVNNELADRVREALTEQQSVREVKMFGGLAFMVNDRMAVGIMSNGRLLVRADPARADELLARDGAERAEMGAGRTMGDGWIAVSEDAVATDESLGFWVETALEHKAAAPPRRRISG